MPSSSVTVTQVGAHLETCVDCKRQVAELSSDSLLDQLRKANASDGTPAAFLEADITLRLNGPARSKW